MCKGMQFFYEFEVLFIMHSKKNAECDQSEK
jgi:hypothetical protein